MRKLLLATVAALSAGMGIAETAHAQAYPTPGTVTVRLNGRFRFYAAVFDANDAQNNLQGSANGTTAQTGTNKLANYAFAEYGRLFPGFDGVAANGLKYGASMEIRQDNSRAAGGGIYGSISGQDNTRGALYFRREWGYIGTDKLGTIRLGAVDGPLSLYLTGTFENFNDGAWNGDLPGFLPGNLILTWPFADNGNEYTTTKAVYLSPQFFGFDFGVSFEPNTGNALLNSGCGAGGISGTNFVTPAGPLQATVASTSGTSVSGGTSGGSGNSALGSSSTVIGAAGANGQSVAGPGCDALSSTPTGDYTRRRNTFEGLVRYRGSFGAFGVAATAGYTTSGRVLDNSTPQRAVQYDDLSIGDFGLVLTYGGLSVGGNYQYGRYNGTWGLDPRGGKPGEAWTAGVSYTIGPVIVGASWINVNSTGDFTSSNAGSQRHEAGLAVGGTYSVAPGLAIFASYLYGERRQNGFDFITGTRDNLGHSTVTSQAAMLGTSFAW